VIQVASLKINSSLQQSPGPDFLFHHDFDVSVVVDLVLFVFLAFCVLSAATG
jgi:hypothetical protein